MESHRTKLNGIGCAHCSVNVAVAAPPAVVPTPVPGAATLGFVVATWLTASATAAATATATATAVALAVRRNRATVSTPAMYGTAIVRTPLGSLSVALDAFVIIGLISIGLFGR